MKRLGLALSGGGFRASLYHLGVIRFLRDAGILQEVSHITSVSGGSVLGAHLVLNWDRYCGSDDEFEAAAGELIRFIQMDIRNRVVRRVPLIAVGHTLQRIFLRGNNRRLTRPGLLEQYYEKHLFGDRCLFELPKSPELHILSTNVSEGCICAFGRDGLTMQHRVSGGGDRFEQIQVGLATIPMAVTASSAFPGFFPPLPLKGSEVGAKSGEFDRYAFTDGGVFDNLGVRMFRFMGKSWSQQSWTEEADDVDTRHGFDTIFVSDAGGDFHVFERGQSGGMIKTALRASDILWDRVSQLEAENFYGAPGYVFASIRDVVTPEDDSTVIHPELQRHTARLRTDLDRFTDLEVRCLVQHGYCVARKTCQSQPDHFSGEFPDNAPWDPLPEDGHINHRKDSNPRSQKRSTVSMIRELQKASARDLVGNLLDFRDWPTLLYVAIAIALLIILPYQFLEVRERAQRSEMVLQAIADTSSLYDTILDTLNNDPLTEVDALPFNDVDELPEPDFRGFEIVTDARVFDLRGVTKKDRGRTGARVHSRIRIRRTERVPDNPYFRFQTAALDEEIQIASRNDELRPLLERMPTVDGQFRWQLSFDMRSVPVEQEVDVVTDAIVSADVLSQAADEGRLWFTIPAETGLAKVWILMPEGRPYTSFQITKHDLDNPEAVQEVVATDKVELPLGSLITFQLVSPEENNRYECTWRWLD